MKTKILLVSVFLCLFLAACSAANNPIYEETPARFGDGVWHGMTYGVLFIWDTFFKVENPMLYAASNVGYWYNCGFACVAPLIGLVISSIVGVVIQKSYHPQ